MRRLLKLRRILLCCIMCCGLAGCPGPVRIQTAWVDSFTSNGATRDEIRTALLECGSSIPGRDMEFVMPGGNRFPDTDSNKLVSVAKCMEISGFPNKYPYELCTGWTKNGKHVPNNLPACQPDAVIPKRSVENRLNSLYCQYYPKVPMCLPAYDPRVPQTQFSSPASSQSVSVTSSVAPSTDPATKLQNQVQKDSNAQMNQLLQGAGGRK